MGQPIFSLSQIELLGEAGEVFQVSMLNFGLMAELLAIFSIEMTATVFMHKIRVATNLNLHIIILLLAVFSLSLAASMSLFGGTIKTFASSSDTEDSLSILTDDFYLWETQYNNTAAFKKFGSFGYFCKNIENYFFSGSDSDGNNATDILTTDWSSELGVSSYGDNIMTGKFEGQNVVLIVIESGEWYAINKEYTPTLYALASQGIAMTNYYARDKTDKSEALAILGSYPIRNSSAIYNAGLSDHNFAFTSANILGADGYTTNYFHPGAAGFYSRKTTHGHMYGFDNLRFVGSSDRLENAYGQSEWYDFQRDGEMISQYLDEYMQAAEDDSAFFTMMMTMMTHGHYEDLVN